MTIPSMALGLVCSLLLGSAYHLWRDGGSGRLAFFLALSVCGFALGQWFGDWRTLTLFPIGSLNLGIAAIGSLIFLGAGDWLSRIEFHHPAGDNDGV